MLVLFILLTRERTNLTLLLTYLVKTIVETLLFVLSNCSRKFVFNINFIIFINNFIIFFTKRLKSYRLKHFCPQSQYVVICTLNTVTECYEWISCFCNFATEVSQRLFTLTNKTSTHFSLKTVVKNILKRIAFTKPNHPKLVDHDIITLQNHWSNEWVTLKITITLKSNFV